MGRTNQLAADECGELGADMRLRRLERPDGAAVEDLSLHRAPLQHTPLGVVELVEARLEEGTQGRRHVHLALLGGDREHLRQEERIAAGRLRDAPAERGRQLVTDQLLHVLGRKRLESKRDRPLAPSRDEVRPARAEQQDRAPDERRPAASTRSRNVSSPQWMSSNRQMSGACSRSSLRNAHAISSALVAAVVSPTSDRSAVAATGSEGTTASCRRTSVTGQYVMPSP